MKPDGHARRRFVPMILGGLALCGGVAILLIREPGPKMAEGVKELDGPSVGESVSPHGLEHRSSRPTEPEQEINPRLKGRLAEIARLPAERRAAAILEHADNVRMESDPFGWAELRIFVSEEMSDKTCERVLSRLLSSAPGNLPDAKRSELVGAASSNLAGRYGTAEFTRLIDESDKWGRLAWSRYAIIRASEEPQEILAIRPADPLFVPEAQANAATSLAGTDADACRSLIEDGTISPTSRAFDASVKKMLSLNSMECTDWLESLPEDNPARTRGYRVVAGWLTEIGRTEDAKAYLEMAR
jgi:hypothetical protein